jgi:SAM-dependent methyltransferase
MSRTVAFTERSLEFRGTGPGAQTRDGCSVEVYRRASYAGQIEHLRPRLKPGTTVLELGCGTGLITHRLLEFGCNVTGVDNSADMLAHVSADVRRIHCDIERLALDARFDVVLLPSGLINHGDAAARRLFVAAGARHLLPDGQLILNCQDPAWLRTAAVGHVADNGVVSIELLHVDRRVDEQGMQVRMTLRYSMGEEAWTHSFTVVPLEESAIAQLLQEEGFGPLTALDESCGWFAAGLLRRPTGDEARDVGHDVA